MRNGAGEWSRGQSVKATQVEVRQQTLSQDFEVQFVRAGGTRVLSGLLPPCTWC